jgi:hypothetical protein
MEIYCLIQAIVTLEFVRWRTSDDQALYLSDLIWHSGGELKVAYWKIDGDVIMVLF